MTYRICVVGLGYVGLPLAIALAKKHEVLGFDINVKRIEELRSGWDRTLEVDRESLEDVSDSLKFSEDIGAAKQANFFIVTVPTPIDASNEPDLSPIINSSRLIGAVLKKGDYVIYESTVYPGVTEDICVPILESSSKLKYNRDFFCGYSPERINPGDRERKLENIVKVTSGSTRKAAEVIDQLYKSVITAGTHAVSSIRVAEAAKVIENTQRDVNIALINELAIIFDHMEINTDEVLQAASTKWNFINLSPGLVGGHCIGVDPYYLTFKAEQLGYKPNLILAARQINNGMGRFVAEKTVKQMIREDKEIKGAAVLVLGLAFKENCPDIRNTKVVDVIEGLKDFGIAVDVYDPWVKQVNESKWYSHGLISDPLKSKKKYDAIVLAVAHSEFTDYSAKDFASLSYGSPIVIDVKSVAALSTWRL